MARSRKPLPGSLLVVYVFHVRAFVFLLKVEEEFILVTHCSCAGKVEVRDVFTEGGKDEISAVLPLFRLFRSPLVGES
eukprot:189593-Hanusia_phi.AAC.1